jgi:hypothetical protein
MGLFGKVNIDKDAEVLKEEKERQSSYSKDWDSIYWKPVPKADLRNDNEITEEVGVRILLPSPVEGADWYLKMSKHFIRHPDGGFEQFTCMREVYGEDCVACEKYFEILEEVKDVKDKAQKDAIYKRANAYKPTRFGVFNVLGVKYVTNHKTGQTERQVDDKVKLFQAPISLWTKIVSIHSGRGRSSDFFDEFDDKGNISKPGRDIIVVYDKDQAPANRYNAIPTDYVELGTPEQISEWVESITPLTPDNPENVAYKVDPEVAQIRTFGTKQEREQLRELLKEMWLEERKAKEAEEEAEPEQPKEEPKAKPKTTTKKKEEASKEEPKPEPKSEPKPEKPQEDKLSGLRAKLDKIKQKQD